MGELRYGSDTASDTWRYLKGRSDEIQKKVELSLSLHLHYPYNGEAGSSEMSLPFNLATRCHKPQDPQT